MAKTVLGLDIGTKYIKYVELVHLGGGRYKLSSVGMTPAPSKGLNSDAAVDQEAMSQTIKKLLHEGGIRTKLVNVALPEANVFTRIIQVPPLSERELSSALRWEAEQYIPLPLDEVQMDFSMVGESQDNEGNKKLDVLLVAAPKNFISRYSKILDMCDLEPAAIETEIISASRSLLPANAGKQITAMVVNLGAQTSDFSILRNGVIAFTRSIPTGGVTMTRVLAQDLGLPLMQAEEYKKTYGLLPDMLEGKVFRSLKPVLTIITEEIKRSVTYFQNKFNDEVVSTIILAGGCARLPGLVGALVEAVGLETQIGNPWLRIEKDNQRFQKLDEEGAVFAVAAGLAMRET